jgi:RNA polymerase sigma-70 factor (ECF subfamily)
MAALPDNWQKEMIAVLPKLRRFAYSLTGSPEDADDLMQMVVEKALMNVEQFQPGSRMDNWLFRICKNQWIDEWRKRDRREKTLEQNKSVFETSHDGERATMHRLRLKETQSAMQQLGPEQQQILALVAIEGKSYRETAEILEMPIGTIMSRLARARSALAKILDHSNTDRSA